MNITTKRIKVVLPELGRRGRKAGSGKYVAIAEQAISEGFKSTRPNPWTVGAEDGSELQRKDVLAISSAIRTTLKAQRGPDATPMNQGLQLQAVVLGENQKDNAAPAYLAVYQKPE